MGQCLRGHIQLSPCLPLLEAPGAEGGREPWQDNTPGGPGRLSGTISAAPPPRAPARRPGTLAHRRRAGAPSARRGVPVPRWVPCSWDPTVAARAQGPGGPGLGKRGVRGCPVARQAQEGCRDGLQSLWLRACPQQDLTGVRGLPQLAPPR